MTYSNLIEICHAMLSGAAPPRREVECPSCMGSARIRFYQSPEDPSIAQADAACGHCHEEAASEPQPIPKEVRDLILKVEGTWSVRLKDGTVRGEGTHAEMEHLAGGLREQKVDFTLRRTAT